MTSDLDSVQTNEFLRRRKLRFQQVREQSKDISRKIRQRVQVEKLRQVSELDSKKTKEYLRCQERLVKKLEEYYSQGIENVGASHKFASVVQQQDDQRDKVDLSKKRGKEATAELRKKRQQALDEQKKGLDRKLQAREAANELSREKSTTVLNKIQANTHGKGKEELSTKVGVISDKEPKQNNEKGEDVARNDMATQWDIDEVPNEWEPNIPALTLPKDDNSVKESNNNNVDSKSDKSRRLDLFALSDDMPSSLRGGLTTQEERAPSKSSLTLVSEYLLNRGLRLRESETAHSSKKSDDLQSLKQTIFRTRASKEVSAKSNIDKGHKTNAQSITNHKRNSVTMYNHSTRDCRDVLYNDERLVVRESQVEDDAYSQAMKESNTSQNVDQDHQKKIQEIRSKVAMTKQNVEKEYRDTMSFLNALPKDRSKPNKTAFMDEQRQQTVKDNRQQKLQQEYRKIEKECIKHSCRNKSSKSPTKGNSDVFEDTDFQYSWMPVPEGDGNLAIHTIPTALKESKSGNTVKFSKVDSYHEYRSRHKHTPPTKDTNHQKQNIEKVLTQSDSSDTDSGTSDSSTIKLKKKGTDKLSDAERIIVYKILDSKANKKAKTTKLMEDIAKSLTLIQKQNSKANDQNRHNNAKHPDNSENKVTFEQLNEGVYKTVNVDGDNIASMYFNDEDDIRGTATEEVRKVRPRTSHEDSKENRQQTGPNTQSPRERGDIPPSNTPRSCCSYNMKDSKNLQPSTATSNSSLANSKLPSGFIKVIDDGRQEADKFYIGASGLLKDDAYEVIIQLRKKGDEKESVIEKSNKKEVETPSNEKETGKTNIVTTVSPEATTQSTINHESSNKSNKLTPEPALMLDKNTSEHIDGKTDNSMAEVQFDINSKPVDIDHAQATEITGKESKNVCDKGVSTSFQDTNAISKPEPVSRPATSIYTQTSISSPSHRPVFLHMSSSTSTAYMSPPEMILPKFKRHDRNLTDDKLYEIKNYKMDDIIYSDEHQYLDESDCQCKKCKHATKITLNKRHATHRCRKKSAENVSTPINTASSTHSHENDHIKTRMKKCTVSHKKSKCSHKCENCKYENDTSIIHETQRLLAAENPSRNLRLRTISSAASSNRHNQPAFKKNKTTLKPVIKNYIDKLLVLNKESLKAVQVIDQDCSSVTTPGSSIINMPNNNDKNKPILEEKISLQQIQTILKQKIEQDMMKFNKSDGHIYNQSSDACFKTQNSRCRFPKMPRKKIAHKVKTLNISRNLSKHKNTCDLKLTRTKPVSSSSSTRECVKEKVINIPNRNKTRSKSSPTPRLPPNSDTTDRSANSDLTQELKHKRQTQFSSNLECKTKQTCYKRQKSNTGRNSASSNRDSLISTSPDFGKKPSSVKHNNVEIPMTISTQTSINVDSEINFMKLAEDKLQNMEKIADLTEKCTQRLSNLAKVLEEVRKNKSLAYSQMSASETASDSDQKSDKIINNIDKQSHEPICENNRSKSKSPVPTNQDMMKENDSAVSTSYIPFLSDIPKPVPFKNAAAEFGVDSSSSSSKKSNSPSPVYLNIDHTIRNRGKPPPALSRVHLKNVQDFIVPHELSTVVEVDSPLSLKLKSSRNDIPDTSNIYYGAKIDSRVSSPVESMKSSNYVNTNTVLLENKVNLSNEHHKLANESSDNSKMQMIDLTQFNEIMLKPFFSLQEYAKQCNIGAIDDGSNIEDIVKNDNLNDELSSLHSEASLPDVISELLKRNIISEPFKFDTGSNANSTNLSSESTVSMLALSKARQTKKKSNVMFCNKENIGETSDTLSISSNPDLENAFKKLGMGWASSTLKKTKERLALSSSSNTSSSSVSQFKVKSFNQDIPELVSDTVTSVLSKKPLQRNATDNTKNAQQQTSLSNSMTVKEFLTNELAKKITFDNRSRNDTQLEFVSLYETKIPEELKHSTHMIREENSIDNSMRSCNNNRARTSTPVQLFKSMTYHSSSSSNMSNGLFSNINDLSSVKVTSNSLKHSTSDKDDLVIPNFSLRMKRGSSECSKSE